MSCSEVGLFLVQENSKMSALFVVLINMGPYFSSISLVSGLLCNKLLNGKFSDSWKNKSKSLSHEFLIYLSHFFCLKNTPICYLKKLLVGRRPLFCTGVQSKRIKLALIFFAVWLHTSFFCTCQCVSKRPFLYIFSDLHLLCQQQNSPFSTLSFFIISASFLYYYYILYNSYNLIFRMGGNTY